MKNIMKRRNVYLYVLVCTVGLLAVGCDTETKEDDDVILIEKETEETSYNMGTVVIDDVVLKETVTCTYQQTKEQKVSFNVSDRNISQLYVEEGDFVKKGQVLARLSLGDSVSERDELAYKIERNKLLIDAIEENEKNEIAYMWMEYEYNTNQTLEDKEAVEQAIKTLQQSNRYEIEDLEDSILIDSIKLEELQAYIDEAYVYADMPGMVTSIKSNLVGSTSVEGETIMKVIDNTECVFAVDDMKYATCFEENVAVEMTIVSGNSAGTYQLVPYDMENWTEQLLFSMADGQDDSSIDVGSKGSMTVIIDSRQQVLTMPVSALHGANGKYYVYVIGENNMREIKWVEIGLRGKNNVEIISGLKEGEKVILK